MDSIISKPQRHQQSSLVQAAVSGALAGGAADSVLHALDTIKTRTQGQHAFHAPNTLFKYNGLAKSLVIIAREEGIRGLFGGLVPAVVGSLTSTFVYFGSYEYIKRAMINDGAHPLLAWFVAGGVADVFASVLYVPTEVIKVRLQLQGRHNNVYSVSGHNYRGTVHAFHSVLNLI